MATLHLSYDPIPESLHVYLNGSKQTPVTDWSLLASPPRVQFVVAPNVTDRVEARYAYTGSATYTPGWTTP